MSRSSDRERRRQREEFPRREGLGCCYLIRSFPLAFGTDPWVRAGA